MDDEVCCLSFMHITIPLSIQAANQCLRMYCHWTQEDPGNQRACGRYGCTQLCVFLILHKQIWSIGSSLRKLELNNSSNSAGLAELNLVIWQYINQIKFRQYFSQVLLQRAVHVK